MFPTSNMNKSKQHQFHLTKTACATAQSTQTLTYFVDIFKGSVMSISFHTVIGISC